MTPIIGKILTLDTTMHSIGSCLVCFVPKQILQLPHLSRLCHQQRTK